MIRSDDQKIAMRGQDSMHDTRWTVLELIRTQGHATVASLTKALGVSAITVRHHLANLQSENLIAIQIERGPDGHQSVGRPKYIYTLTEAAQRYFPNQYHVLTDRLLETLKAQLPPEQVEAIIDAVAAGIAARHNITRTEGTLEQRMARLVTALGEEGFMAEVERVGGSLVLTERNCPYLYVSQHHPEVCRIDRELIRKVLGSEVEQTSCVLNGDTACVFVAKNEQVSA
jgi:predicted ArsR family transcriptional regulator